LDRREKEENKTIDRISFITLLNHHFAFFLNIFFLQNKKKSRFIERMRLNIFFLLLFLSFLGISCEKPPTLIFPAEPSEKENSKIESIVVFSTGEESRINHADLTVERASIGAFFKNGDTLITGANARVDVQISDETLLRFKEKTEAQFIELKSEVSPGKTFTRVFLKKGKMVGKVNKNLLSPEYYILTPETSNKIDGTEFFIETLDGKSTVKVVSGKITTQYFVEAIENRSIAKNSPLGNQLESRKVQIEAGRMVEISGLSPLQNKEKLNPEEISSLGKIIEWNTIPVLELNIKKQEEQEIKTLVLEDARVTKRMIAINEEISSGKANEKRIEELEAERSTLENQILKKQSEEKRKFNESIVVAPKKLKNRKEIVRYYERMEKIILTKGRIEIGAIISQEGDEIIIHTEYGIKRIPNEEVVEVIYEYQRKAKL
jgi:hypothetical protein